MYIPDEIERVLIEEQTIKNRVSEMGRELTAEYSGKNPLFIGVLKGSVVFFADLIRQMGCPLETGFLRAKSYGSSAVSSGNVEITCAGELDIKGRSVIIIEDILDTGRTLYALKNELMKSSPESIKIVTLLDKPSRRAVEGFSADYTGFSIDDYFVVGYGLDYAERFRYLPYVGILKPATYS